MGREINTRCIFAERLLEDYLFGHIQAVQVQAYAALVEDMDIKNDLLHTLAEFGSRGKHASNVNQQLKDFIKTYVPAPKASEMQLRMQITKGEDRGEQTLPHFWMPIHVWLWWLYSYAYQAFLDRMVGPAGALLDFWSKVDPADPRLEQIPRGKRRWEILSKFCIPIIIHGDGVPCTKRNSLEGISFQSTPALRNKFLNTLESIFYISGLFKKACVGDDEDLQLYN